MRRAEDVPISPLCHVPGGMRLERDFMDTRENTNLFPHGLGMRTWEVCYEKLKNMVEGARLAEAALNGC
jgi:hypothetical protein